MAEPASIKITPAPLFETGDLYLSRGVADRSAIDEKFREFVSQSLMRHKTGDWGDLCSSDKQENEFAIGKYLRIFSAYENKDLRTKIWIITEADRKATTVLFPEEY